MYNMSKQTYKLDLAGFNRQWVKSFKSLDDFLKSPMNAGTWEHIPEDKRKQMFTKVYNECTETTAKSALAESKENRK